MKWKPSQLVWIKLGYEVFALEGPHSLKIEGLAETLKRSKSSFYHYFADLESFISNLLDYHLAQCRLIAVQESQAQSVEPELLEILLAHRLDVLFNRQLRVLAQQPLYASTLNQANLILGQEFIRIWREDLKPKLNEAQLQALLDLALDNFFLQINAQNLHRDYLNQYFGQLKQLVRRFS